jgi:hypothetical protein
VRAAAAAAAAGQVIFVFACVMSAHLWITTLPKSMLKPGTLAHRITGNCLAADNSNVLVTVGMVSELHKSTLFTHIYIALFFFLCCLSVGAAVQ